MSRDGFRVLDLPYGLIEWNEEWRQACPFSTAQAAGVVRTIGVGGMSVGGVAAPGKIRAEQMDRKVSRRRRQSPPPSQNGASTSPRIHRDYFATVEPPEVPGRTTEDEELLNRSVPTLPRAKAPELAAFTHSDPWRVLRIQGEFVHGINSLAEVGAAVAVFGSARFGSETRYYAE